MKRYVFPGLCLFGALCLTAFKSYNPESTGRKDALTSHYFKFVGVLDQDEDDRTEWEEITQSEFDNPFLLPCFADHLGCKLIASEVELVDGEYRPKEVYVQLFTHDPTIGAYVSAVYNYTNF